MEKKSKFIEDLNEQVIDDIPRDVYYKIYVPQPSIFHTILKIIFYIIFLIILDTFLILYQNSISKWILISISSAFKIYIISTVVI